MTKHYDIFISYAHDDSELARSLHCRLERAGVQCFLAEKDIPAGGAWASTIRQAIKNADRVLLLITPNSKTSQWVVAEAGAAWVLGKPLIAAVRYVKPSELIEPISSHQARVVDTPEQIEKLVAELSGQRQSGVLAGQWVDPSDGDVVYFKQAGNRAVGYYDYGTGTEKIGLYRGTVRDDVFEYRWRWLNGRHDGHGRMTVSADGDRLSGEWWYGKNRREVEHVGYRRVSQEMPSWLREEDFQDHYAFLGIE